MSKRILFVIACVVLVLAIALRRSGYKIPRPPPTSNTEIIKQIGLVTGELSNSSPETTYLSEVLNTYHMNLLRPKVSPQVYQVIRQLISDGYQRGMVGALTTQQNTMNNITKRIKVYENTTVYNEPNLIKALDSLPNQLT